MGGAPKAVAVNGVDGAWVTPGGRHVNITHGAGEQYTFSVTEAGGGPPGVYPGKFLKVGDQTVLEVQVAEPRPAGGEATPVYIFGRTRVEGDRFEYEALKREWLEREASKVGGLRVASVSGEKTAAAGTSVAVGDPAKVRALLHDAVKDGGAFEAATVLRRSK